MCHAFLNIFRLCQTLMKPSLKWVGHSDSKDITTGPTNFAVKSSWSTPKQLEYSITVFPRRVSGAFWCWSRNIIHPCTESRFTEQGSLCKDSKAQCEIKPKAQQIVIQTLPPDSGLEKGLHIFQEDLWIPAEKHNPSQNILLNIITFVLMFFQS